MPTLHLIDADSSQACPAVMALIQSVINTQTQDRLLILGGRPLLQLALDAGIEQTHRASLPFGHAPLAPRTLKAWIKTQPRFDRAHAWSIRSLQTAGFLLKKPATTLSLVHTPTPADLKRLKRITTSHYDNPIRIDTGTASIRQTLRDFGLPCEVEPSLTQPPLTIGTRPDTAALRRDWHACDDHHRVVAVLSDHPSLANALDASAITCLAGASLTDSLGRPLTITLLMHPDQHNRKRAQAFLAEQSDSHRVIQDVRIAEPRAVLHACDAALGLGRDLGGLSFHHALAMGTPTVTANNPSTCPTGHAPPNLHPALSAAPKDLAHQLHQALMGSRVAQGV